MSDVTILDREAKEKILRGIQKLTKAVSVALGPCEKNAILLKQNGSVLQTRDVELIAKIVSSSDRLEQFGIESVRHGASFHAETIVLIEAIFREGLQKDAFSLKNELNNHLKSLLTIFDQMAVQKEVRAQNYRLSSGFISPYFITNPKQMTAELDEPYIYVTHQKLKNMDEVLPILESLSTEKNVNLVIFARDVLGDALDLLLLNHLKGNVTISVAKLETDVEKIALLTNAKIGDSAFFKSYLGRAEKVVMSASGGEIQAPRFIEKSILPGYALSYLRAIEKLKIEQPKTSGFRILEKAFLEPLKIIAENAHMNPEIVITTVLQGENDFGFFPEKGIFAPLISLGITESLEDIKERVAKAISTASSLLTIESIIT